MQNIFVFGTGWLFQQNKEYILNHYNVLGFIDNDSKKHGDMIEGKEIFALSIIGETEYDQILVASIDYYLEIIMQLINVGVPKAKISMELIKKLVKFKVTPDNDIQHIKTDNSLYTKQFYYMQTSGAIRSAQIIVPMVINILGKIDSVIDFGCGTASWLYVFEQYGASELLGVDHNVDESFLCIDSKNFFRYDLCKPIDLSKKYDLAVSLETAEHLPEENAKIFIDSLCRHSDAVLFSAAIPGQVGTDHVNCKYPSYWAKYFSSNGYTCADILRHQIWYDKRVEIYYAQSIMLYIRNGSKLIGRLLSLNAFYQPLDVIHTSALLPLFL